ncbi:MAG: response regulator [Planctomycetaceae bacterium]|nr:response regulator [Planctomycetaceae bacterium]
MSSVLIVEDSPADRPFFRHILSQAGYQVYGVVRGSEVPVKAREVRPHAIILDLNLPDTDGHSVCRPIRADPEFASIPVLMLTVRDDAAEILESLEAGADDYVTRGAPGEILLARIRRLIQYRQMETVAVLNEHLVHVGRLLAGIVHEIRGPLAVIRGSTELMRCHLGPDHPHLQWVDPILRNTRLLQVRLEHLMATVRGGRAAVETVDVAPVVREVADLFLKGTDPRGCRVAVEVHVAEGLPPARTDPGRLIQVLFNLLVNAHEAIVSSFTQGRIVVSLDKAHDQGQPWIRIDIIDSGPGIPEALLDRIFEPFFTTKDGGSGFGLYLSREILKEQDSRLTVCNRSEGGACFRIWLPTAEASTSS